MLTALGGKDFATQTTLAAVLAKLSSDPATQTTLAEVLATLQGELTTTLTGSYVGYSTDTKPTAGVVKGNDFLELDTGSVYIYDGTNWVVV